MSAFAKDINVPINDCISRQAAINVADMADYTGLSVEDVKKVTDEVVKGLKALPSAQPEIILCRDCKHFYLDKPYVIQGVPVLGHEVCDAWGDGCKTSQDGYCFLAERRTDE